MHDNGSGQKKGKRGQIQRSQMQQKSLNCIGIYCIAKKINEMCCHAVIGEENKAIE